MSERLAWSTVRVMWVVHVLVLLILVSALPCALALESSYPILPVAKLTASDGVEYDHFGASVSISGDAIVAGAHGDADSGSETGAAYLFEEPEAGWTSQTETAKLTASDGTGGDCLGSSVSIFGNTVVVGAFRDDDLGTDSGSAYLFEKPETGWSDVTETAKLTASDGAAYDELGISVSISGETVIVGAFWDDDNGSSSGSAYLFEKPGAGWTDMTETAKLTASDGAAGDQFGNSVSISGNTALIGASGDDDHGDDSGSTYLFEKPEAGWTDTTETAKLTASDGAEGHWFGSRVSIDGDTLVVGAPRHDSNGWNSGSAYVFEKPEAGWIDMTETVKLTAPDAATGDYFGWSVSISGDTIVVGAPEDGDSIPVSGSIYIFQRDEGGSGNWGLVAKLTASDGAEWDEFGSSVSIGGGTIVVGAYGDGDSGYNSGSAYLFREFEPTDWIYLPVVLRNAP